MCLSLGPNKDCVNSHRMVFAGASGCVCEKRIQYRQEPPLRFIYRGTGCVYIPIYLIYYKPHHRYSRKVTNIFFSEALTYMITHFTEGNVVERIVRELYRKYVKRFQKEEVQRRYRVMKTCGDNCMEVREQMSEREPNQPPNPDDMAKAGAGGGYHG